MLERILYTTLTDGLRQVAASPTALRAFVEALPGLEAPAETQAVADLVKAFAAQPRPVIHGYARDDTQFPVWSIVLAGEQEDIRSLGDESDDDDETGQPILSSVWNSTYQILVYSLHPDTTLYLYQLLRALLLQRRHEMIRLGDLMNVSAISGAELSPDQVYMPAFLFTRGITMTAQAEQRGFGLLGAPPGAPAQPLPVRRIAGLHIRDDRAPPDGLPHDVGSYVAEDSE